MGDWNQAGQGALGGAAAGAAFGPLGAGVGAGIGGLMGYFGSDGAADYQDQLKSLADKYGNMQAPQAGNAAQAGYSGFRSNQAGLISQLEAMARGQGPSAATMQMREGMDRAAGAQASAAAGAGGRGVNAGAALRNASNNSAAIMAQGNRDMGLARVNEQLGAIGQLGQNISAGRGADENVNQFNAGQQNNTALANLQAKLQTNSTFTAAQMQALQMAMGSAGPGLGTQILAGGASAAPGLMQMFGNKGGGGQNDPSQYWQGSQRQGSMYGMGGPQPNGGYGGGGQTSGPVTSPSIFGQYSRPDGG